MGPIMCLRLGQAALSVAPAVYKVGRFQRDLGATEQSTVSGFNTKHERVILITHFVFPRAEATTTQDIKLIQKRRKNLLKASITL